MRIVAGTFRGRPIATPTHDGLRPTSDRVREAVFNILTHGQFSNAIEGARVLDLFAGTGALGIEALSRGASWALFVEEHAEARGLIRQNIDTLGLTGRTRIFRRDATDLGPAGNIEPFDLVFLDPPYGKRLGEKALSSAVAGGWIRDGSTVVLEEHAGAEVRLPSGLTAFDRRTWGDTQVVFARRC